MKWNRTIYGLLTSGMLVSGIGLFLLGLSSEIAMGQLVGLGGKKFEREEPVPRKLVLTPAAEPRQALKYRLLPNMLDEQEGNAAVLYNKYVLYLKDQTEWKDDEEKITEWANTPPHEFELPLDEAKIILDRYRVVLDGIALASVRTRCDWELPIREQNFITILLPEVQAIRSLARLQRLEAQVRIAEGDIDGAIVSLQRGYAMGRHAATGETLVQGLVGMAICRMMTEELERLIQRPDAPNMYWAVTSLPRPMVDMRRAMEAEMNVLYLSWPELREVDGEEHGLVYWQNFVDRIERRFLDMELGMGLSSLQPGWQIRLATTALTLRGYPLARDYLIEKGRTREEVEAMPVPQVVALYSVQTYNELRDQQFKWLHLPYHESRKIRDQLDIHLRRESFRREVFPIASLLLPALNAVNMAIARSDREFALLRTIEAIRLYGAANEGRLPETLDDIKVVPVPNDPLIGEPFLYEKDGDVAHLKTPPAVTGREAQQGPRHFEIRFRK